MSALLSPHYRGAKNGECPRCFIGPYRCQARAATPATGPALGYVVCGGSLHSVVGADDGKSGELAWHCDRCGSTEPPDMEKTL